MHNFNVSSRALKILGSAMCWPSGSVPLCKDWVHINSSFLLMYAPESLYMFCNLTLDPRGLLDYIGGVCLCACCLYAGSPFELIMCPLCQVYAPSRSYRLFLIYLRLTYGHPFTPFCLFFFRGVVVMTFLTKYTLIHKISNTFLFVYLFFHCYLCLIFEKGIYEMLFFCCSAGMSVVTEIWMLL
jgi:hypothetical protein